MQALRWIGMLIYRVGLAPTLIRLSPARVRTLLYHACEADESAFTSGLRSTVSPVAFSEQISFLARHYAIVPVERLADGPLPPCSACITFDDGYRSILEHAAPILESHRVPYTVYLIPGVVGNQALVWVNEVNWFLRHHEELARPLVAAAASLPADAPVEVLIDQLRARYDSSVIAGLMTRLREATNDGGSPLANRAQLYLCWEEVRELRRRGASFGNHTMTHPNLGRVQGAEAGAEIRGAHDAITQELGSCTSFAFPFGDLSPAAREAAIALGYGTLLEVSPRATGFDPLRISRVPVTDASAAALFADVEIVEPIKAWLRGFQLRDSSSA